MSTSTTTRVEGYIIIIIINIECNVHVARSRLVLNIIGGIIVIIVIILVTRVHNRILTRSRKLRIYKHCHGHVMRTVAARFLSILTRCTFYNTQ